MNYQEMAHEAGALAAPGQLDMWPDNRRGAPNAVLRSALFSAAKPSLSAPSVRDRELPAVAPYRISYSGNQLYQPDLDVWLECVHRCRLRPLGDRTDFQLKTFLRAIGRPVGQSGRKWLLATFKALRATAIQVTWSDSETGAETDYVGGLVDALASDKLTGRWQVRLDPRIASLFAPAHHTWLHAPARMALGKSYLAKWLHGFYSTHRQPRPVSVAQLRELSGSRVARIRRFREALRKALDEVSVAERSEGRSFAWEIDSEDRVLVIKGRKTLPA